MFPEITFTTDDNISHRLKLSNASSSFFILYKTMFMNYFSALTSKSFQALGVVDQFL